MNSNFLIAIISLLVIVVIFQYYYGQVYQYQYIDNSELIQWINEQKENNKFKKRISEVITEIKLNNIDERNKKNVAENAIRGFLIGGLFSGFPGAIGSSFVYGTMTAISGNYEKLELKKALTHH